MKANRRSRGANTEPAVIPAICEGDSPLPVLMQGTLKSEYK